MAKDFPLKTAINRREFLHGCYSYGLAGLSLSPLAALSKPSDLVNLQTGLSLLNISELRASRGIVVIGSPRTNHHLLAGLLNLFFSKSASTSVSFIGNHLAEKNPQRPYKNLEFSHLTNLHQTNQSTQHLKYKRIVEQTRDELNIFCNIATDLSPKTIELMSKDGLKFLFVERRNLLDQFASYRAFNSTRIFVQSLDAPPLKVKPVSLVMDKTRLNRYVKEYKEYKAFASQFNGVPILSEEFEQKEGMLKLGRKFGYENTTIEHLISHANLKKDSETTLPPSQLISNASEVLLYLKSLGINV